jgi:CRISPR-associated protein Csd2
MTILNHKIDFKLVIAVKDANPNGDPLNGNRPRQDSDGYGEISDVALKRKLRNRLQDMGESIFVQSSDRADDGITNLQDRFNTLSSIKQKDSDEAVLDDARKTWIDVRTFGQLFAFKGSGSKGISISSRGPLTIQTAHSVTPVIISEMQISKSVNSAPGKGKGSDTLGMKYNIDFGIYEANGSISVQLAEKSGLSDEDVAKIKYAMQTLFEGDESAARPAGSMEVLKLYWWEHNNKIGQYNSAKVHRSVKIVPKTSYLKTIDDVEFKETPLDGLKCTQLIK